MSGEPVRILRIIARLNVGGPAIHVGLVSAGLAGHGYQTRLLAGSTAAEEGDMSGYARERGVTVENVPGLGREIRAAGDVAALLHLARIMREWKPHIVHTHTAKAGTLGRLAALSVRPRPKLVHTFHGHVLHGYFGPAREAVFRSIERALARSTDRLVVPSPRVRDELLALRVGRAEQYAVVPLGFDLRTLLQLGPPKAGPLRREFGVPADALLVGSVGRLTAIKNQALLLEAFARLSGEPHLLLVGDGELRGALEADVSRRGLGLRVHFAGWRQDLAAVYREIDLVALSSDNEGTPVAIIEAMASGRPVIATAVGGVPDLIPDLLVPPADPAAFAAGMARLQNDPSLRRKLAAAGRAKAQGFAAERLLGDLDGLYRTLLGPAGSPTGPPL